MRVKLMKRIHMTRDKMMSYGSAICPKPRDILEKNKVKAATDCIPSGSGSQQIEVESMGGSKYVVDLEARTCACRRWDLSGIPCKHDVAAINFMRMKPEDFVHECYLKKTYMAIYSNTIKPLNGMNLWPRSDEATILPPQYTRQPAIVVCWGHNMKTCHRHLPPKTKKATDLNKKRKLNTEEASSFQAQANSKRKSPLTKNELRQKAKQRAEKLKKKRDDRKAATTKRSNVNVVASAKSQVGASSSKAAASAKASSRSSSRIKENAKGGKK
ncbi:hypothetical protein M0R45_026638 [Rubus argutus]|uniref:SWIM-type domain-containing protein n=1 Tax=Rubus argutus TaxID=59490 RepID=A0AAW1WY37_RUBAR